MEAKIKEQRAETLAKKLESLKVGKEDVQELSKIGFEVEERLI